MHLVHPPGGGGASGDHALAQRHDGMIATLGTTAGRGCAPCEGTYTPGHGYERCLVGPSTLEGPRPHRSAHSVGRCATVAVAHRPWSGSGWQPGEQGAPGSNNTLGHRCLATKQGGGAQRICLSAVRRLLRSRLLSVLSLAGGSSFACSPCSSCPLLRPYLCREGPVRRRPFPLSSQPANTAITPRWALSGNCRGPPPSMALPQHCGRKRVCSAPPRDPACMGARQHHSRGAASDSAPGAQQGEKEEH